MWPAATPSGPLASTRSGSGPPLVLIHGLGSARTTWDPLLDDLSRRYDVLAVDLPGHGDSPALAATDRATPRRLAAAVADHFDALGWGRPHLMGNSLGGWVGLELAADGRAASLTALAPAGLWLHPLLHRRRVLAVNRQLARAARGAAPRVLRSPAVRRLGFASASALPGEISYDVALAAARAQADAEGFDAAADGTLGLRFDRAAEIPTDVPVTVVFGDRDRILPARSCQEPSLVPAHARWVVLPRCGHVPQWDAPGTVLRLLAGTISAVG